jgi:hypothetical protein
MCPDRVGEVVMSNNRGPLQPDPLFPAAVMLPLAEAGGHTPLPNVPGRLRPFSATLAVPVPPEAKKHDTDPSSWVEREQTQRSSDGRVEQDSISHVKTDS